MSTATYRLEYANDTRIAVQLPPDVRVHEIGTFHGFKVYTVDGTLLRLAVDIDFVAGGTGSRYAYVPIDEIWLEMNLNLVDLVATLRHEFVEFGEMTKNGLHYNEAHDIASAHELKLRQELHANPPGDMTSDAQIITFLERAFTSV